MIPVMALSIALAAAPGKDVAVTLLDNLFTSWVPGTEVEPPDMSLYSVEEQALVSDALCRLADFEPLTTMPEDCPGQLALVAEKRQSLERTAVALCRAPWARREIASYLEDALLYYEWEGYAGGPMAEAAHAEAYLAAGRDSVLAPFLTAFLLHRYRAAWECAMLNEDPGTADSALELFELWYGRAMESGDSLLVLVAREIRRSPWVYVMTEYPEWPD